MSGRWLEMTVDRGYQGIYTVRYKLLGANMIPIPYPLIYRDSVW